jgi:hypothetical protein
MQPLCYRKKLDRAMTATLSSRFRDGIRRFDVKKIDVLTGWAESSQWWLDVAFGELFPF